jgi:hypothetical protein
MAFNYNQNDPIYKNYFLGNSKKYTLNSDGCYVFSLARILNIDPVECNNTLKAANCFAADSTGDRCLLDHTLIARAFPSRISSVDKIDPYDNQKCLDAIAKYGAAIVYVDYDGNAASAWDTHFVVFTGNKQLFDSLGGVFKPTSTYPLLRGLRIVNLISQPATPTPPSGMEQLPKDNVIRDAYLALAGECSDDEVKWRLSTNKNIQEIIIDICSGDARFYDKWIKPRIPATPPPIDPNVELTAKLSEVSGQLLNSQTELTAAQIIINKVKAILYGKGWPWTKCNNLKLVVPK